MATGVFGKLCMTTYVLWHTLYGKRGLCQALYDNRCLVAHSIWQDGSLASSVWQHMSCGTLYMATGVFGKLCMTTDVLWHILYGKRGLWQALYGNICLVAHSIWQKRSCGTLYMATGVFGKLCMTTDVLWHTIYCNRGLWQAQYGNICLVAHSIWQEGSLASSV